MQYVEKAPELNKKRQAAQFCLKYAVIGLLSRRPVRRCPRRSASGNFPYDRRLARISRSALTFHGITKKPENEKPKTGKEHLKRAPEKST